MRICKGNAVPVRDREGGVLLVVEAPDPRIFESYLENLKMFLEEAVKRSGVQSNEERLELIADLIALFYKAPLLEEPIRGLHLSPFKVYLTYRMLRSKFEIFRTGKMKEVLEDKEEGELEKEVSPIFKLLDSAAEKAEVVLTGYPADTRPGYNISNLLIHLLTVSALAWSRGYHLGLNRRESARLRIASLLHDIGKPLEPKRHVSRSKDEVVKLLEGLVDREDLNAIVEIVAAHHDRDYKGPLRREVKAIREADSFSSGIDRLGVLVKEVVLKELAASEDIPEEEAFKRFYSAGSWEAWEQLETSKPGTIEKLTKRCVRALVLREVKPGGEEIFERTSMLKLDVASIQDFITESEKLPLLAASSYIVDLAVMFNSLRSIQEELSSPSYNVWYPIEGFLYSAGGNILAIVPDGLKNGVIQALRNSFSKQGKRALGFGPLKVRIATVPLKADYGKMMEALDQKLLVEKISLLEEPLDPGEDPFKKSSSSELTGVEKTCDYCGRRPATNNEISIGEETYLVCEECKSKYDLFKRGHMRSKWLHALTSSDKTVGEVFGLEWSKVRDVLIELIAGHNSPEEVRGDRLLNVAVLKVDGNLMGAFMARSISLSDALERSARIDLALKKAFRKVLKVLYSGVSSVNEEMADKEEARLLLGIQYMGGDDALIFSPSWAALPLSLVLMVEFAREMGYSVWTEDCAHTGVTLSVGLAAAPARHNIWALLDAANSLLSEAKLLGRLPFYMGTLAFDVTEGGLLTGRAILARKNTLSMLRLTSQPWILGSVSRESCDILWTLRRDANRLKEAIQSPEERPDALKFLTSLLDIELSREVWNMSDQELESIYSKIFERVFREYISERRREAKKGRLRRMRNVVRELEALPNRFDVSPGEEGYEGMVRLFAVSKAREKKRDSNLYRIIVETFSTEGTPLEDINRFCKILLGGAG